MIHKMEEVDEIIVYSLRAIGCEIDDSTKSLQQFSTDLIVDAAGRCLNVIDNGLDLPHRLPPSMSARFRIGTNLANAVQELGYKGELGYQTFLYPTEADIRRVFMFLIEKLPKEAVEEERETLGAPAVLRRAIAADVARRLAAPWTPPYCKVKDICWRGQPPTWQREGCSSLHKLRTGPITAPRGVGSRNIPQDLRDYYANQLAFVTEQLANHRDVAASVLHSGALRWTAEQQWEAEWNDFGLASRLSPEQYKSRKRQKREARITEGIANAASSAVVVGHDLDKPAGRRPVPTPRTKGSRFTHSEKLQFTKDEENHRLPSVDRTDSSSTLTKAEREREHKKEVAELQGALVVLAERLEMTHVAMRKLQDKKSKVEERKTEQAMTNTTLTDELSVKTRTARLLPNVDENIAKLQALVETSNARLASLSSQWEKHRTPMMQQYEQLKLTNQNKESDAERWLDEIRRLRGRMRNAVADTRDKQEAHKQLVAEYESMSQGVPRSAYTRRILEIVSNIKKQKEGIEKVLLDTRAIQKEINHLAGKLNRTFIVTDELIFKDAKKDESVRAAYKHLAALHENCSELTNTVEETGSITREIRELEDQIATAEDNKMDTNFTRISSDLKQVKKENSSLMEQLGKMPAAVP